MFLSEMVLFPCFGRVFFIPTIPLGELSREDGNEARFALFVGLEQGLPVGVVAPVGAYAEGWRE